MDVVFHRRDLGLGVEQVRVGVSGDHVTHGRLIYHFIDLHIFVYYRADRTVAEFIARLGGYAVQFSAKPISLKSPLLTANPQSYATQSISLVILCTLVCPSASGVIVVSTVIPG